MTVSPVLDYAGRRRSPATLPGYHAGRAPRNKGLRCPADPPTVEEIIAVMRQTGDDRHGFRLRALIIVLWRGGLRIQEALALGERDLAPGAGRCWYAAARAAGAARSAWTPGGSEQLRPWLTARVELPIGPLFCVIDGPTRGRPWSSANVRVEFRRLAAQAGIRRRFAPHQLRHAHAVELAREGVPLNVIQRQLGHANLGTTSIYLQGIDTEEIIATVHARRADDVRHRRPAALSSSKQRQREHGNRLSKEQRDFGPRRVSAAARIRPTQQRAGAPSGAPGLLLCQEAGVSPCAAGRRPRQPRDAP